MRVSPNESFMHNAALPFPINFGWSNIGTDSCRSVIMIGTPRGMALRDRTRIIDSPK